MRRLLKIPERIGINIRRIILEYAIDSAELKGDTHIDDIVWYFEYLRYLQNKPEIVKHLIKKLLQRVCKCGNIDVVKWMLNRLQPLDEHRYFMKGLINYIFYNLGINPVIDVARLLVSEMKFGRSLGSICYISWEFIIERAYTWNNICVVKYLLENFDMPNLYAGNILNITLKYRDQETHDYVWTKMS